MKRRVHFYATCKPYSGRDALSLAFEAAVKDFLSVECPPLARLSPIPGWSLQDVVEDALPRPNFSTKDPVALYLDSATNACPAVYAAAYVLAVDASASRVRECFAKSGVSQEMALRYALLTAEDLHLRIKSAVLAATEGRQVPDDASDTDRAAIEAERADRCASVLVPLFSSGAGPVRLLADHEPWMQRLVSLLRYMVHVHRKRGTPSS